MLCQRGRIRHLADCPECRTAAQSRQMPAPLRLRLEPKPSRAAFALTVLPAIAAAALTAALALPWWATLACAVAIGLAVHGGFRRAVGDQVPALVHVGIDRTITVTDRRGRSRNGVIDASSYVGARLTIIVWRANGAPAWRSPGAILFLPDVVPADDFRRLRIFLRYGSGSAAATRGVVHG